MTCETLRTCFFFFFFPTFSSVPEFAVGGGGGRKIGEAVMTPESAPGRLIGF